MTDDATTPTDSQGPRHQVVAYTEKSQIKHESRHVQLVREYGFHPRTKATVEDGGVLPKKYEPFPENMYGRPLEEIDQFIYEETFCVVSKRFRKNYIHRFTGTKSLFYFTPWSSTRRACVYLATNQFFDYCVMATILFNCIFLAMSETVEEAEYIFLAIYSAEMVIKIIAKGFVLNKYTYLRNPWNWLDFVVITSGYATMGMEVGNLAGLRTFRVLRALKTVSIMPGLKTIINALLHSFKQLAEVMTLTIFCLMVFALFALQVYMGELRNKCVRNMADDALVNITHEEWHGWINDTENWIVDDEGVPMLCGNLTGARHCPMGFTCLCIGENPNHGYTNFDNFMWSMLTTFQLITLDYWENVYNMILATCGPMSVSFFTIVVFFGSFYLINLMLAVVALSYEEEAEITLEERKKDLLDHRDDSTFSFDPTTLNVKKLNKHYKKKIDSRKGVLLASYSRKKIRRRKKKEGGNTAPSNGTNGTNENGGSVNTIDNNQPSEETNDANKEAIDQSQDCSVTPTPSPSPRHSCTARPQALALQRTRGVTVAAVKPTTNTLHPLGPNYRGQLVPGSRQASSNASEGGGVNRESSLDDSGVVDDHEETTQEITAIVSGNELVTTTTTTAVELKHDITPVTLALSPHEVRIIKCNGNLAQLRNHSVYALPPEYLSQIVVIDDLTDRNCDKCVQCCVDYEGWLQFQNCLYKIVRDPLFELAITLCIMLNTLFLALEHHGMSESVRQALDIGNKVFTSIFTFECIMKLMALSKDFFQCGWNIFDLIIVSASLVDIIFELVDGLSVLRGLRLLRVLKLAQSWTTMKVLLSIIISTIGALGNLTLVLVIVIYIFAVIGMQLFSKDYTPDKFYPDPVPRWNFNDFFHSFMMIFRILCGEWIEPLWDCMRAEEKDGASTCFAIFLPTLVMGNFMVLNLFLALLLNSFNSEELKSKKEEVGEDSKLARSFDRIRSIVRKKRLLRSKEKNENETNSKLEQLVNEVIIRNRDDKKRLAAQQEQIISMQDKSRSLPITSSDYHSVGIFDLPMKETQYLHPITGSQETVRELIDRQFSMERQDEEFKQLSSCLNNNAGNDIESKIEQEYELHQGVENPVLSDDENQFSNGHRKRRQLLKQMSSGFGTSKYDSRDTEPTTATTTESIEMRVLTGSHEDEVDVETPLLQHGMDPDQYLMYQKTLVNRSPSYRKSVDRVSLSSGHSVSQHSSSNNNKSIQKRSHSRHGSENSANTLSMDPEELSQQMNLRDELLNCDKKELFQFLSEDFNENSNNYFSETVGYGSAMIELDTESLIFDAKNSKDVPPTHRKTSSSSLRSNLSYISNSIFQKLEERRGGSISEPADRNAEDDEEPLVKDSEFETIIRSFEKELNEIRKSTNSLNRRHFTKKVWSNEENLEEEDSIGRSSDEIHRRDNSSQLRRNSVKLKRRSLEKQKKVDDSGEFKTLVDIQSDSPKMRLKKSGFHSSFDRIKRTSLIERVEEVDGEMDDKLSHAPPTQIFSEKLPRKTLCADFKLESLSLKSTGSYENLFFHPPITEKSQFRGMNERDNEDDKLVEGLNTKELTDEESGLMKPSDSSNIKAKTVALAERPWHCLVSYVDDLTVGGRRNSQGVYEDPTSFPSFGRKKAPKVPQDCFPQKCYERCPCWNKWTDTTKWGHKWTEIRTAVLSVVDTPAFEWFVLVLIFASSITLCFEDIYLDQNIPLKRILYWTNLVFCLIFVIEMVLKWLALGFTKYFASFWTILDFIIVFVSVFSLLIEENENLKVLRSLRTLRALRPLRAISRWQGMRIVVNALMYAIPSIFNVLLVCLVFWLIFSIMGVQFFGGKFFKCVDDEGELLEITIVNDKWQCFALNYTWINSKITFDHVGMGYLALLQVATFEGWMEVMADAVDARGVDLQPQREANLYAYIYFVIFIVCGSFFTLNLFIGVIIDNFNMLKKRYEGGVLEMFLTESQKHYYTAMKKLGRKKPQKVIKRPINHFLAMFYDLSNSRRFEIAIFVLIFLNMLTMGIEHYNQPHAVFFILEVSNAFFTTVFGLEAIVKIVGLRYHYFTVPWNVFDFLLVLASIFGILMEDIMIDLPISPTLLRVVRVFRIGRILRLIKAAKGIRKLLFALVVSLPALFNIGALLALITFIYAILGMSLFGHVRLQGALDDMVNFTTFGRSMQLLFRLMTSAGWNDVLESLMIQPPDCDPTLNHQTNGDCGHPLLAITYFTSFIIISYMIVINMYIAIILENFNQAHQEEEIGIVEDDLEMFYIRWSKYDPHATQFIHFSQLSDFIASLDPPLGIPKPNTVALVSFNLPISKGNKIHCLDILHALVKHVLGHVEETDNFKQLQEQMDVKFKKQFPTRKELEIVSSTRIWKREDKAARTIQHGWKEYLRLKRERERSPLSQEDENTQTSSPGGWQSKLSALNFLHLNVHRRGTATSSRASSRKSSRASDASDLSELAGPWLNLPLMLVGGANDLVHTKIDGDRNETTMSDASIPPALKTPRRRSFYNFPFFLRHQDAVDDAIASPSVIRKAVTPTTIPLSALPQTHTATATEELKTLPQIVAMTPKSKRATSFIRKKPPLERGLSAQSALRINRNPSVDVSILVTEPSPETPIDSSGPSKTATVSTGTIGGRLHIDGGGMSGCGSTLVHVLVHRESEEYQTDLEDNGAGEGSSSATEEPETPSPTTVTKKKPPEIKITPGSDDIEVIPPTPSPHPIVTIMVESPQDSPRAMPSLEDIPSNIPSSNEPSTSADFQFAPSDSVQIQIDADDDTMQPIDVNAPRDTTNIFYDYTEPQHPANGSAQAIPSTSASAATYDDGGGSQVSEQFAKCHGHRTSS